MRRFLFVIVCTLLLSACTASENSELDSETDVDQIKTGELDLHLAQVLLKDNSSFGYDSNLEFDLYLERPDIGLKEPLSEDGVYTIDLPLEIQPKYMYVSEVDDRDHESGNMCDRPRFPHRCSVTATEWEDYKDSYTFLIKVTFEDGYYAEKEVTVPFPKTIALPEVVEPSEIPLQGESLNMQFKDVGADFYDVDVNLCWPYENDGINPCLDGVSYSLKRDGDSLVLRYEDEYTDPEISLQNEIVTIKSNFSLMFGESIEYYVKAILISETADGIATYTEISDFKNFETGL